MVGLPTAAALLEELRDQLQADTVTAAFGTGHGLVEILVAGQGVALEDRG